MKGKYDSCYFGISASEKSYLCAGPSCKCKKKTLSGDVDLFAFTRGAGVRGLIVEGQELEV